MGTTGSEGDNMSVNRTAGQGHSRVFYGWIVVILTFATLLVSAGVRSMPGILIVPFEKEFAWGRSDISAVISLQILLYGLTGPFAAALMERFGLRKTMLISLTLLAAGISFTPFMTSLWQFTLFWGLGSGLGTGTLANVLGATLASRWFVERRGTVVGLLTASAATGQLIFLPLLANITVHTGWRFAVWTAVGAILLLIPVIAVWMRNHPADIGLRPYGAKEDVRPVRFTGHLFKSPLLVLWEAMRSRFFWLLAGTFFICGFSTNGLIGTHLIAACGDFGITEVTAAGLLAFMGLFDLVGTTFSGWLSDRFDNRWLLFWYYGLRGLSLLFLPFALDLGPIYLTLFAVFYGLDWIATVPPTVKLSANLYGVQKAGMVFGWIVAFHQLGASFAASEAGFLREWLGNYTTAFTLAGYVCLLAALMALGIRRRPAAPPAAPANA